MEVINGNKVAEVALRKPFQKTLLITASAIAPPD